MWHNKIGGLSAVLGGSPAQHGGLRIPALPQPQQWLRLQLGSHSWPGNSICCGVANNEKRSIVLVHQNVSTLLKKVVICVHQKKNISTNIRKLAKVFKSFHRGKKEIKLKHQEQAKCKKAAKRQ